MRRIRRKIPATATAAIKTRAIKTRAIKSKAIKAKAIETKAINPKAIKPKAIRIKPIKTKPIKTKAIKIAAITIKATTSQREAASFPGRPASSTASAKSRATACRISMTRRCRNCRRPATCLPMLPRRMSHGYQADEHHYAEDEAAPADHDYQETRNPGRRTALVAVMAIFGLVVVGSAGAFGYRAMFGGSVLPTLPPIIKASNGPNKIALDPQAGAASNAAQAVATTGSTENLVSREEQPVTIDAPKSAPRVVSTIPIVTNGQSAMPPGMSGMPPATTGQTGPNRVAAADSPWPAPPSTLPAPAPAAAPAAAPPAPVPVSSEPKKIHTVTIRADQTGAVPDAAAGPAASGAARAQSRPAAAPRAAAPAAGGGAAPMSIVPAQGDAAPAPPPRTRTAVASTAPSATPSAGGGSYAQVTSRRTEGEAQTEFRALQARFPTQLSGREPVIRRADLGEKGIYYRALVGPFASTEEAAQLCSSLKAAGQNCIVQRN